MEQAHLLTFTSQLGLISTTASRSKDLLVPASAFLCDVCTDRGTRQADMLVLFRTSGSQQLVTFEQVSISP